MSEPREPFDLRSWMLGASSGVGEHRRSALSALATAMLASAVVYCLLWDVPGWMQFVLMGIAVMLLFARSAVPVAGALVWTWGVSLLPESDGLFANESLRFADVLAATTLLIFVLCGLRYLELKGPRRGRAEIGVASAVSLRTFAGVGWRLATAVGAALTLLWLIPPGSLAPNSAGLQSWGYRTIAFCWMLTIAAVLPATAFSLLRWRRLTPRQAAVYVHQELIDETGREHRSLERRRARGLLKQESD